MTSQSTILTRTLSFETFLVERQILSEDLVCVVRREMYKQQLSLEKVLLSFHLLTEPQLTHLLSDFSGLPAIDLRDSSSMLPDLSSSLSKELGTRLTWVPFKHETNRLHIAVSDPLNKREIEQITYQLSSFECVFYVGASSQIEALRTRASPHEMSLSDLFSTLDASALTLPSLASAELIPAIFQQCLKEAVQKDASDIHFEPEHKFIRLRLRIDGQLAPHHFFHKDFWDSFCVHLKICAQMNIAESRLPQSGHFSKKIEGKEVDFRVSTHPTKHGESIVVRLLDRAKAFLPLEGLGFPSPIVSSLKETIQSKQGLFIVSGPTGSGKTTTLYSLLSYLNSPQDNIMTLEQPIEYELPFVRQTEIPDSSFFTFSQGIRSVLRQDPDILFIGEVRDGDTAQMALRASMTGHQVFTTLHTGRALGAIQRLTDLGVSPSVLAGNLRGLLSQRLVRKLCSACRRRRSLSFQESCLIAVKIECLYDAVGCTTCHHTGYQGRFPLVEFIPCTNSFNQLILENSPLSLLEKEARATGYVPLPLHGIQAIQEGATTLAEVSAVISLDKKFYDYL
jgi:type IV pilus assembly protein PilB